MEKSIADEELVSESVPPEPQAAVAVASFAERTTEALNRSEVSAIDYATDTAAEQPAPSKALPLPLKPGDKIVAFEPYHYGGKPKKDPETAGIVRSIYADGQYVSYMRLDGGGRLGENGNKAIADRGLRLADSKDLKHFDRQFAELESKFRETSLTSAHYKPGTGTVNVHDKTSVTDHTNVVD